MVVCRLNLYGYLHGYLYGCCSRHPYTVRFFTEQQNTEKLYEVQPAWHQVLVVAAHQTICRGEIRMKTFTIGPAEPCDMPMSNIIQAIGVNSR